MSVTSNVFADIDYQYSFICALVQHCFNEVISQLVLELDSVMPEWLLKYYARAFIDKKEDAEDTVRKKIMNMPR